MHAHDSRVRVPARRQPAAGLPAKPPNVAGRNVAKTVTIHPDEYGVPHICGPTDIGVGVGLMCTRAEETF